MYLDYAEGNSIDIDGRRYELQGIHYHAPGEHLLDGRDFAAELHLVHGDPNNRPPADGIDRSAAQLGQARSQNPGVSFIEADIVGYEFPGGQRFDFFTGLIAPHFAGTSHVVVVRAIRQFVAWGKRPD